MWLLYVMKRKSHMRWWNFPEHKKSKVERYIKRNYQEMKKLLGEVCKIYYNEAEISNDRMKRLPFREICRKQQISDEWLTNARQSEITQIHTQESA